MRLFSALALKFGLLLFGLLAAEFTWRALLLFHPAGLPALPQLLQFAENETSKRYDTVSTQEIDDAFLVHPFLGFQGMGERLEARVLRLRAAPPPPAENPILKVAVLGGSVAERSCDEIEAGIRLRFPNRTLQFVCAATPAHGEPQQASALQYLYVLGFEPEVVINIDGVNDVGYPRLQQFERGLYPTLPQVWPEMLAVTQQGAGPQMLGKLYRIREQQQALSSFFIGLGPVRYSAIVLTIWQRLSAALESRFAEAYGAFTKASADAAPWKAPPELYKQLFSGPGGTGRELVRIWKESALLIAQLCSIRGCEFIHAIQPNPWVLGSKPFSAEERAFMPKDSSLDKGFSNAYRSMGRIGKQIERYGGKFIDLVDMFKDSKQTLYIDSCCHLNSEGQQRLADEVVKAIRPR